MIDGWKQWLTVGVFSNLRSYEGSEEWCVFMGGMRIIFARSALYN